MVNISECASNYHIIPLNIYNFICHLYLNKAGKNSNFHNLVTDFTNGKLKQLNIFRIFILYKWNKNTLIKNKNKELFLKKYITF